MGWDWMQQFQLLCTAFYVTTVLSLFPEMFLLESHKFRDCGGESEKLLEIRPQEGRKSGSSSSFPRFAVCRMRNGNF